jgi:hypothetical protein
VAIFDWNEKNICFCLFLDCDMWHFVRLLCVLLDLWVCPLWLYSWWIIVINVVATNVKVAFMMWSYGLAIISSHRWHIRLNFCSCKCQLLTLCTQRQIGVKIFKEQCHTLLVDKSSTPIFAWICSKFVFDEKSCLNKLVFSFLKCH